MGTCSTTLHVHGTIHPEKQIQHRGDLFTPPPICFYVRNIPFRWYKPGNIRLARRKIIRKALASRKKREEWLFGEVSVIPKPWHIQNKAVMVKVLKSMGFSYYYCTCIITNILLSKVARDKRRKTKLKSVPAVGLLEMLLYLRVLTDLVWHLFLYTFLDVSRNNWNGDGIKHMPNSNIKLCPNWNVLL